MKRSSFQAPRTLESFEDVAAALREVQEALDSATGTRAKLKLYTSDFPLVAGSFHRVTSQTAAGLKARLPSASGENLADPIYISLEGMRGPLEVWAAPGQTVNGGPTATFSSDGIVALWSNGLSAWAGIAQVPEESGGTVLEPIPDQRVLGNDSGVDAFPVPITVHQELDWIGGAGGGSVQWVFDGVDDRIDFGDILNFERTDPFTLSCWFATSSAAAGRILDNTQADSTSRGWQMFLRASGQLAFILANDNNASVNTLAINSTLTGFNTGALSHFLISYDGSSTPAGVTFRLNGVAVAMTTLASSLTGTTVGTNRVAVGAREDGVLPFTGTLLHAAVWSGLALNSTQAAEVYNSGTPPDLLNLATTPDPVLWAKIDASDVAGAGGVHDYGTGASNGTAEGGLAPSAGAAATIGALPVRGASLWQPLLPGTVDFPLVSNGPGLIPAYERLTNAGLATAGAHTYKGNNTAGVASVTDVAISGLAGAGMTATGSTLNVIGSTSITVNADSVTRPALTGAITASADSNVTAFGSAAAKSVLVNATNGAAVPAFLAGTGAFQHLRVNSANTALEWAVLSLAAFPTMAAGTVLANVTAGVAVPTAHALATLAGSSLDYTNVTGVIDYVGNTAEITNTTATGNLGTIDISALTSGGSYRVTTASSSFSIEGFTAKPQGFWFYFSSEDDAGSDEATLFHEDATATATNRIRSPQRADIVGIGMRGILFYAGSRWNWVSDNQQRIGGASANVTVQGNGSIDVDASGVLTMNSGAASAASLLGVSSLTLSSTSGDVVAEHNAGNSLIVLDDTGGGGLVEVQEAASTPATVPAGRGGFWVLNETASVPIYTSDTNTDHRIKLTGANTIVSVSGTVNNAAITNTTSAIHCTADTTINGIAPGYDGQAIDIYMSGSGASRNLTVNHASGSATGSPLSLPAGNPYGPILRGGMRVIYDLGNVAWRCVATASDV
jgi:hypothetical protein